MKIQRAAVAAALVLCASLTLAQTANKDNSFSSTLSGGINLRSIAGAPFSADVVKESIKTLPDGSSVPVLMRGKMFRDAEGRTRSETEMASAASAAAPRRYVTIVDPVQRVVIILDPQTKTAKIAPLPVSTLAAPAVKPGGIAGADRIPANSLAILGAQDLGDSMLQGFSVTGSRRTRPAEAAPQGDKARNIVVETWFSPELKIELQAKIADPKLGAMTTSLENIVTAEPDRALFEPPADYTVQTTSTNR